MPDRVPSLFEVFDHQKTDLLLRLLKEGSTAEKTLVFLRSRDAVHALNPILNAAGISTASLHGNKKPELRERTLREFREGKFRVLVATESVLREADAGEIDHVVYFEFYEREADFRGHLESKARLSVIITQDEHNLIPKLEKATGSALERTRLEGFPYASQPKNKRGPGGGNKTGSKPLQHKKPKLKDKGPRRKTGRTRKR